MRLVKTNLLKILVGSIGLASPGIGAEELLPELKLREPAATGSLQATTTKTLLAVQDEEDLQVQTKLPEAIQRIDSRGIQKNVFKALYQKELQDSQETTEE